LANFGFQKIDESAKQGKVQKVFSDVASKYDIMNDLMSLGLHRIWKNRLVAELAADTELLDLAGGTGDIACRFLQKGGKRAVVLDLNQDMLKHGREKWLNTTPLDKRISFVCANIEALPFDNATFDCCTIAFGIRNVTNIAKALSEAHRVLRPGGKFVCLEFSKIEDNTALAALYDFYSFRLIPRIGKIVTGNSENYQYLVESIRMFPTPQIFSNMMEDAGFKLVTFSKMTFGIVALYSGWRI
jgi:demethylmenaquinone methyltransferase/2-methoxy-6-polyprenyl-1,4-benzoquinol methylase